ncbi:uncharacterized protein PG986_001907 [Apiospora aurea]|uniref:Uncharacterized protein n=1 Tax=Apiospora aurea TaxID=335848 RepID=A0ABR1QY64_9PEZI
MRRHADNVRAGFSRNRKKQFAFSLTPYEKATLSAHSRAANAAGANDFSDTTPVLDSATGAWKAPVPLQEKGQPSVSMYQDLAKWFATLGVPAGAVDEAATEITRGIFVVNMDPLVNGQIHSASCHYTPP